MDPAIFKAYDIRGLSPGQLEPEAALSIGRAVARFLGGGPVVVGRDMRETSPALRDALCRGLASESVEVIDIGRVTTPMVYFATTQLAAAGGVMITASHNPGAYNGFKTCARDAKPVGIETGLARVRDLALELHGQPLPGGTAAIRQRNIEAEYFDALTTAFPDSPALNVAIDCGNGIVGAVLDGLLERLPIQVTRLYFEPDGSFPNHEANPLLAENLVDLIAVVREQQLDLGIAFDGDGDRAVFIDERGEIVPADLMTGLFASFVIERGMLGARPGSSVVYDLRSSRSVAEIVREVGGEPLRSRVGHAFIKETMRRHGACFGGELSGHYYFPFESGYVGDDASAAMLLAFQLIGARAAPLSELIEPLRRYQQSGEINSEVDDVQAVLEAVKSSYADGEADELDGLTVAYPDWWFNLRPSNTEPLLRLNVEAASRAELTERRDRLLALIRST